jgi:WD40 repeat protein
MANIEIRAESGVIRWDVATGEKRPEPAPVGVQLAFPDNGLQKKHFKLADRGEPAAFSPDGRLVAVIYKNEVTLIEAATAMTARRFKSDGARFLYDLLFRAPVLGGTPKLLVRDIDAHPVISADGQRMIYIRCNNPEPDKCRWLSANSDGTGEQLLLVRTGGMPAQLSWSPDGKRLAFTLAFATTQKTQTLSTFDVAKNQESPVITFPDKRITDVQWMPDGRGIVILYLSKSTTFTRTLPARGWQPRSARPILWRRRVGRRSRCDQ